MDNLESLVKDVCLLAKKVGAYLKEERTMFSLDRIEQKNNHDYVSYVDRSAEEMAVEGLRKIVPEAGFVTEEGSATYNGEQLFWVIDPLDGTTNYIHDNSPYCVSIALRRTNEVLIGVVFEVCRNECFYAWKDGGAYVDGKPIKVNKRNDINSALLCLDLPYLSDRYMDTALHLIKSLYSRAGGVRMNGSAAASFCYVAAGRFDGWLESYLGSWDFMAGILILREAGGMVTDFNGNENCLESDRFVASNGIIHNELLTAIQQRLPQ